MGAVISRFDDKWVRTLTLKILLTCLDSKYSLIVEASLRRLGSWILEALVLLDDV
jgi:hypothetical protein